MPLVRDSMRHQIKQLLLERIMDGTYKPGDRLVELQIAQEFKTSQAPVREALRDLEALRVVESESYRGTRVREVTERELRETYQVRGVLEELAAQLAAPRLKGNVKALEREMAGIVKSARANDVKSYVEHNTAFHRKIIESADNAILLRAWDGLVMETRSRITLLHLKSDLTKTAREHEPILEALRDGDGAKAGRLLRAHIDAFFSGVSGS